MVYGREIGGKILDFEASGGLLAASLVMRDRQTDSWWSIMTSTSIGGALDGTALEELPVGEKTTWGEWRRRHPDTLVLSVGGREHLASNPYDGYFSSAETFRSLEVTDDRLPAKEPVYSFWLDGVPWAAPHRQFEGGRLFDVGIEGKRLLLFRQRGAEIYESSEAWLVDAAAAGRARPDQGLVDRLRRGEVAGSRVEGFDTFWYTWVAVHQETRLLRD